MELHLFDFDGTLFKSPEYKPSWWSVPGDYSWFVHPASLTEPCVPLNPDSKWWINRSVSDAKESLKNRNSKTIICTGRVDSHKPRLVSLLNKKGLKGFDGMFFNPGIDAKIFKINTIEKLHKKVGFTAVHIWENENYDFYKSFVESKLGIPCVIHVVDENHIPYTCKVEDIRLDGQRKEITNNKEIPSPSSLRVASRYADEVPNTIIQQLGGLNQIKMFTGLRKVEKEAYAVTLTFPLPRHRGAVNSVRIFLNGRDTYDMEFYRSGKLKRTETDVYADRLKKTFEEQTGLYLSF